MFIMKERYYIGAQTLSSTQISTIGWVKMPYDILLMQGVENGFLVHLLSFQLKLSLYGRLTAMIRPSVFLTVNFGLDKSRRLDLQIFFQDQ